MMLYMCHTEKVNINIIEKQCSLSILNISILAANEDENHFLEFEYKDQNGDKVNDVKFEVNFDGGSKVEGTILRGFHRIESVPDEGFNLEFVPGDQLEKELAVLRKELRTALDQSIQQVKAESVMLSKTWEETAMWKKPIIYAGGGITGAGQWVVDSVEGLVDIATGIAKANAVTYQWVGDYIAHRGKAFSAFASGDEDGLKREMKQIESMHTQLGEDISDVGESVKTLGLIAWDDETRTMLTEFPMDYFSELHSTEKVRTGLRYGIDFALIFVGGVGAGLLAIKNAGKISRILKKIAKVIEMLRLKLKARKGKVDTNYKFKANGSKKFETKGVKIDGIFSIPEGRALFSELKKANPEASNELLAGRTADWLKSGKNLPVISKVDENTELYKLVPKGAKPSTHSPYFMSNEQRLNLERDPGKVADIMALPKVSEAKSYDVYKIKSNKGENPTVFTSEVAPAVENGATRTGGGIQIIVPNRALWGDTEYVKTIGG